MDVVGISLLALPVLATLTFIVVRAVRTHRFDKTMRDARHAAYLNRCNQEQTRLRFMDKNEKCAPPIASFSPIGRDGE